jgi:hypothetical protein
LRYVPYVGPWIAALLPITVSLVTVPGWEQVLIVIAMFLVLELLSNNVMEPLLYGHSVGLSSLAVIVAAIFWTWLWGAVGLVIATPITACLVVFSRYVPELGAIARLLGEKPAFPTHISLYQRWLAHDVDEAEEILQRFEREHSLADTCELLLRTLLTLRRDLAGGRVAAEDGAFICARLSEAIEELPPAPEAAEADSVAGGAPALVLGVPVTDPLDAIALKLVGAQLRAELVTFEVLPESMIGEVIAAIETRAPAGVVVPSLPPGGLKPARHMCRRLRGRGKRFKLLAARLGDSADDADARVAQLAEAGCAEVVTSLPELVSQVEIIARAARRRAPAFDAEADAGARGVVVAAAHGG